MTRAPSGAGGAGPRRWAAFLIPVGITLALLAGLEGGCRAARRLRGEEVLTRAERETRLVRAVSAAYRTHPFLGVAGRPHGSIRAFGHEVILNSRGQRGDEPEMPKPKGRFRVICEGGSTTFDYLAPDNAHTWPAILGRSLANSNADVVNAGFPGWTTAENLISLSLNDLDLAPDLVILYAGINDLQPAGHIPFAPDYSLGHGDLLPRNLGLLGTPLPWLARSAFLESLLDIVDPKRPLRATRYAASWEWKGGPRRADIPDEAVRVFARNVRSIIGLARAHGARTLLIAQSARFGAGRQARDRDYVESWAPGLTADGYRRSLARYREALVALASETGAALFDPFASGTFVDADFWDPFHFAPPGSERFASLLAGEVARVRDAADETARAPR